MWGRLRKVKNQSSALVAEYTYNGLNYRIGWHYDVTRSGSPYTPDGTVDANDPWYWFCHDINWRVVATLRADDANAKEKFVHNNAGLGGLGGSSYIDAVALRDRDANTAWYAAADSTAEERRLMCPGAPRPDVVAVLTDTGKLVESVKYGSYGVAFGVPVGDTDSDGDWDATDSAAITGSYEVWKDADLDGDVDAGDVTYANSITGSYQSLGRTVLSSSAVNNRKGYAGYELDPAFLGAGRTLMHVRNRVLDADLGRWLRRDPAGYVNGVSVYENVRGRPSTSTDPYGLAQSPCGQSSSQSMVGIGGSPDPECCARLQTFPGICHDCCDSADLSLIIDPEYWLEQCHAACDRVQLPPGRINPWSLPPIGPTSDPNPRPIEPYPIGPTEDPFDPNRGCILLYQIPGTNLCVYGCASRIPGGPQDLILLECELRIFW